MFIVIGRSISGRARKDRRKISIQHAWAGSLNDAGRGGRGASLLRITYSIGLRNLPFRVLGFIELNVLMLLVSLSLFLSPSLVPTNRRLALDGWFSLRGSQLDRRGRMRERRGSPWHGPEANLRHEEPAIVRPLGLRDNIQEYRCRYFNYFVSTYLSRLKHSTRISCILNQCFELHLLVLKNINV